MTSTKPKEPWLPVQDLEAKYVRLAIAMGHARISDKKTIRPDKLESINQDQFAKAIAKCAPHEGVTRELLRDQIAKSAMRPSHQMALSACCAGFPVKDRSWTEASADDFMIWWNRWRDSLKVNGDVTDNAPFELVRRPEQESFVPERMASIMITLNQSPEGSPWPLTGQVRCFPAPFPVEVAIKRAWLQVEGRGACRFEIKSMRLETKAASGTATFSWSGTESRPVCEITSDQKYLGCVDLPDEFCEVHGLRAGSTVTARLAAYIKDLTPLANDDAVPDQDAGTKRHDTYSWYRPGYTSIGQATKDALLSNIELLKKSRRYQELPGASEGWVVVCECTREFVAKQAGK